MRRFLTIIMIFFILALLVPYIIIRVICGIYTPPGTPKPEPYETVSVYVKNEDKVAEMNMSQYLKEVVAAEMPAEFEIEALKAQAVAARTYLINRKKAGNEEAKKIHHGADICTDSTHCKARISEEERKKLWGEEKADKYWTKISDAVESTSGITITYNNEPISAVFHSTSSGYTENASDVWGGNVPYLVSVESKGDEQSPRYRSELVISEEDFRKKAFENIEGISADAELIGEIERSEAGGIKTITVCGAKIKGSTFRNIYALRSTNVEITQENGNIRMEVTGSGHGVGMSQYGANYLASQGMDYREILKTYYTGVEIE